jgi:hypothetical protein
MRRGLVILTVAGVLLLARAHVPASTPAGALRAILVHAIPVAGLWTEGPPADVAVPHVIASPERLLALLARPRGKAWEIVAVPRTSSRPEATPIGAWARAGGFFVSAERPLTLGGQTLRSIEGTRGRLLAIFRVTSTGTDTTHLTAATIRVQRLTPPPELGATRVYAIPRPRLDPAVTSAAAEIEVGVRPQAGVQRVDLPAGLAATAAGMLILLDIEFASPGAYALLLTLHGSAAGRALSTPPVPVTYRWLIGRSLETARITKLR